jgi:hypothetical protein
VKQSWLPATRSGSSQQKRAENERLKKGVATLRMERGILKWSRSLLRQGGDVKFGFVAKHRKAWPVSLMGDALGVLRCGFNTWLVRPHPSQPR